MENTIKGLDENRKERPNQVLEDKLKEMENKLELKCQKR